MKRPEIKNPAPEPGLLETMGVRAHHGFGPREWRKDKKETPMYWGLGSTKKEALRQAAKRINGKNEFLLRFEGSFDTIEEGTVYFMWENGGLTSIHGKTDGLTHDQGTQTERQKPSIEDAIRAWESDRNVNPQKNIIVRGKDRKPVEIVLVREGGIPIFGIRLNGEVREKFQFEGEMQSVGAAFGRLQFKQFLGDDLFDKWYDIKGICGLDAQVDSDNQGFVYGFAGEKPVFFPVRGAAK